MNNDFTIDLIRNQNTLNIFTDVSTTSLRVYNRQTINSCYGAVAVNLDNIVDEDYGLCNECSSDSGEIRGIRKGLSLAFKHRNSFKNINIFSDNQYIVHSLNEWFYNSWRYDPNQNCIVTNIGKPIKNQSLILECIQLLENLRQTNIVTIYHISGHVLNTNRAIKEATDKFRYNNAIRGYMDYTAIRYAVIYNNYVDNKSRSVVRTTDFQKNYYKDMVTFYPHNFIP